MQHMYKGSSGRVHNIHLGISKIGTPTYIQRKVERQTCEIHIYSGVYTHRRVRGHTGALWRPILVSAPHCFLYFFFTDFLKCRSDVGKSAGMKF